MGEIVVRTVSFFSKAGDNLEGEVPLLGIDLPTLQGLFDVPVDDPMVDSWPVGPRQASALQEFLPETIDLDRYDYFVECSTAPAAGVPADHEGGAHESDG